MSESETNGLTNNITAISVIILIFIFMAWNFRIHTELKSLKREFNTYQIEKQSEVDSLVNVVIEHKPDRIFFDAYQLIRQHEIMRDHQLQLLNANQEWIKRVMDELYYEQYGVSPCHWADNLNQDEWYAALRDTSLLVNQMP